MCKVPTQTQRPKQQTVQVPEFMLQGKLEVKLSLYLALFSTVLS